MSSDGSDALNPKDLFASFDEFSEGKKEALDVVFQIISVLLKTSMFVASFVGCLLDNTVPGKCRRLQYCNKL